MCLSTGKVYIGSSTSTEKRFREHKNELKRNLHCNSYLQRAWNKHGENNFKFEIIEITNPDFLMERELYWFEKTNCCNPKYGFNIAINPTNGVCGRKHGEKSKLKIREARKHQIFTYKDRLKMSIASKGKNKSETHKENIKSAHRVLHIGSKNVNSKLNEWIVRIINQLLKQEILSQKEIARIFNINRTIISKIKNKKIWKHVK